MARREEVLAEKRAAVASWFNAHGIPGEVTRDRQTPCVNTFFLRTATSMSFEDAELLKQDGPGLDKLLSDGLTNAIYALRAMVEKLEKGLERESNGHRQAAGAADSA